MLVDVYVVLARAVDRAVVAAAYARFYAGNPFVRVVPDDARAQHPRRRRDERRGACTSPSATASIHVLSALDNLGKGAAGQAVQNMNVMLGFPEERVSMLAPPSAESPSRRLIEVRGGIGAVPGVRLAGVHAGIKKRKSDLALIALDGPHVLRVGHHDQRDQGRAAARRPPSTSRRPARGARARRATPAARTRAPASAAKRDARATARQAATLLGCAPTQVVVASTGVIGVYLPMDRVAQGPRTRRPSSSRTGRKRRYDAAEAIMTTDHVPKLAAYAWLRTAIGATSSAASPKARG